MRPCSKLRRYQQLIACRGGKFGFIKGGGPCGVDHALVGNLMLSISLKKIIPK